MIDVTKVCRICLNSNEVMLVNVFKPFNQIETLNVKIAVALEECTGLKITKQDVISQNLCKACLHILYKCYKFKNLTLKSNDHLLALWNASVVVKNETNEDEDDKSDVLDNFFESQVEYSPQELHNLSFDSPEKDVKVKGNFNCDLCSEQFKSFTLLENHLATHNQQENSSLSPIFECNTNILESILKHADNAEIKEELKPEINFQCAICSVVFEKHRSLISHMKKHKNKYKSNTYTCDMCQTNFGRKSSLLRHIKSHSTKKHFNCNKCTKSFSRKDQYDLHMNTHEGIRKITCLFCNKKFNQMCNLKDHMRVHTGEKPFLCPQCGRGFNNSSNLRQHLKRHAGIKTFACNICPKKFLTNGQMQSHLSTHTGEHPFSCDECGATFTKPQSLKKHQFNHLGLKPYECDVCLTRFTGKDQLKRHQRIHTGEKPYQCKHCTRVFTQSNDLVRHLRTHVGKNIYTCSICDMSFRLKSELNRHYPEHNDDKKIENDDSEEIILTQEDNTK